MIHKHYRRNVFKTIQRESQWDGFAEFYLAMSWDDNELVNKADRDIYRELITIDEKLGTSMASQLFNCIKYTYRQDIFKVWKPSIRHKLIF